MFHLLASEGWTLVAYGPLQPLHIPKYKWEEVAMDFLVGLPKASTRKDAIWVVIDRITKSAHFVSIEITNLMQRLANMYINPYGIPVAILLYRDPRFTSKFGRACRRWRDEFEFQSSLPPADRWLIGEDHPDCGRYTEDACTRFKGCWIQYLPLIKSASNNSFQESIRMSPYEALYGSKCRSPLYWDELGERQFLGLDLEQDMREKVSFIWKRMLTAQIRQKSYADKRPWLDKRAMQTSSP